MQLPLVKWFIRCIAVAVFAWKYWGTFADWLLDKYYSPEDEVLWYFCLFVIMVLSLGVAIGVYRP